MLTPMYGEKITRLIDNIKKVIVGKDEVIRFALILCVAAGIS